MALDLLTLLKILEAIGSLIAFFMNGIAWLFSGFGGLGLSYLQSSVLIGIVFLAGFYATFVLLKIVTKFMIFALTIGFIGLFLGALVGII